MATQVEIKMSEFDKAIETLLIITNSSELEAFTFNQKQKAIASLQEAQRNIKKTFLTENQTLITVLGHEIVVTNLSDSKVDFQDDSVSSSLAQTLAYLINMDFTEGVFEYESNYLNWWFW